MLWERINAKHLGTMLLFNIFNKTGDFAIPVLICWAVSVHANQYISTQK